MHCTMYTGQIVTGIFCLDVPNSMSIPKDSSETTLWILQD